MTNETKINHEEIWKLAKNVDIIHSFENPDNCARIVRAYLDLTEKVKELEEVLELFNIKKEAEDEKPNP